MSVNHPPVNIFRLLDAARRARAGGGAPKATLLALMERMGEHDGEWTCWPSQAVLAFDSEQTDRSVRNHLAEFEQRGWIERRARGRGNEYVLNVAALLAASDEGDLLRPERGSAVADADRNVDAPDTGTPVPPEVPGELPTTPPTPQQAGGRTSQHDGTHPNCRPCGTNPRGPKPPPPAAADHPANRNLARDTNPCRQCEGDHTIEALGGDRVQCPRCSGSGVEPSRRVS